MVKSQKQRADSRPLLTYDFVTVLYTKQSIISYSGFLLIYSVLLLYHMSSAHLS